MNLRRWLIVAGILIIAALLAFPLRGIVYQMVVVPMAYLLWLLSLLYHAMGQAVWWFVVVGITAIVLAISLIPDIKPSRKVQLPIRPQRGKVETLSAELTRANKGIYFKWLVANRLGKLAYQMLILREHGKPRSVFAPLTGDDWMAEPEIQNYLEKGLYGSFADFPTSHWGSFLKPEKTPLDHDVAEVVEFLEARIESNNKPLRHGDTENI